MSHFRKEVNVPKVDHESRRTSTLVHSLRANELFKDKRKRKNTTHQRFIIPPGNDTFSRFLSLKMPSRLFCFICGRGKKGKPLKLSPDPDYVRAFLSNAGKERGKKVIEPNGELQLCSCPRVGHEKQANDYVLDAKFSRILGQKGPGKKCP